MQPQHSPPPTPMPAPPPYRTPAWYDPRQAHVPCQCPRCRHPQPLRRRRMGWRIAFVALGGIALPLASLAVNAGLHVVQLGALGTALLLLSVASVLAHLLLAPRRPDPETLALVDRYPRSAALRVALLAAAALSCVSWGYLALLFLPLIPISLFALAIVGLGLCGLCPYAALSIALHHTWRGYRAVRERLGQRVAATALLASLLLPVGLAGGAALRAALQRQDLAEQLARIELVPRYAPARMRLIAALAGEEQRLVDAYAAATDTRRQQTIAAAYHRITDDTIDTATLREHGRERERAMIRPFAFLQGRPILGGMVGPFSALPWLR